MRGRPESFRQWSPEVERVAIELRRIEVAIQAQWPVCDAAYHATLATRRAELTRRLEDMKQREIEPLVIQRGGRP